MFVGKRMDLCARLEVELLHISDSVTLLRKETQLVAEFCVLIVFEGSDVVQLLNGALEKLVQLGCQILADLFTLVLFKAEVFSGVFNILLNGKVPPLLVLLILPAVCLFEMLFSASPGLFLPPFLSFAMPLSQLLLLLFLLSLLL